MGYWDMLLRLLGKHLIINGSLQGSLPSQTETGLNHIDIVTEFEFEMGSYSTTIRENSTWKTLGIAGLVLCFIGFIIAQISSLTTLAPLLLLSAIGCLIMSGIFLLRNIAIQRNPGTLRMTPLEGEEEVDLVLRIIHDRTVAERYIDHFQTVAQRNIDLEANQYINILDQGGKIGRAVVNRVAAKATLAPHANTDEIAKLLAWNKMDTEGLDVPEDIRKEIEEKREKYLKELEEEKTTKQGDEE